MGDLFKSMIKEQYYNDIFSALDKDIAVNYSQYDLETRANEVSEVLNASLDHIEILHIRNIKQNETDLTFNLLVNCDIEVEDYMRRETVAEIVSQWFELGCSAILGDGALENFTITELGVYNK